MPGLGRIISREQAPLYGGLLLLAGFLAAVLILVSGWEYGADDVRFVREYSTLAADGEVAVDWSRVAADWLGSWAGNQNIEFYRPVVSTSLALDFALFDFSPGASAALNVLLHFASALLLFFLAQRVFPDPRSGLIAAALFGCTPLAHENLAWAVGRCGLTTLFGIAAALSFLRGWSQEKRGLRLHAWPLFWSILNLATMESAVAWTLFPLLCLLLRMTFFRREEHPSLRELVLLALPYLALLPLYLGWRGLVLTSVFGDSPVPMQPQSIGDWLLAPLELLYESLVPRDATWFHTSLQRRLWHWLCLLPLGLGLLAPLWFPNPKSAGYRRALGLLLLFWFASRVPNMELRMGEGLEASRAAYYSYPLLALLLGLLLATSRYAFGLGLLAAVGMASMLWGRLEIRITEAEHGRKVLQRLANECQGRERALAFVNQVNGQPGAPSYHAGELALALAPPFVSKRIDALSLHLLIAGQHHETHVAAAIAEAAGGLAWFKSSRTGVRLEWPDLAPYSKAVPRTGLDLQISAEGELNFESTELPPGELVLFVVGGPVPLRLSLPRNTRVKAWPEAARASLAKWRRLLGPGAAIAAVVELRRKVDDHDSALLRSSVCFARLPRM